MATHDYDIANQSGAAFRTDLNNALAAIQSNNSNSSSPATTVAYQWWADTTNGVLKIRNSSNNAWVELFQLDGTLTLEDGSASACALGFRDDLNTGVFSSDADHFNIATGGTERVKFGTAGVAFNDGGADYDFRIESDTNVNCFTLDAAKSSIGINVDPATGYSLDILGISGYEDVFRLTGVGTNIGPRLNLTSTGSGNGRINATNNALILQTGGNDRLAVESDGKVGIGTSSPSVTLHVNGGDGLLVERSAGTSVAGFKNSGSTSMNIYLQNSGSTNHPSVGSDNQDLTFGTNNNERFRVTSNGPISIGETSIPDSDTLFVNIQQPTVAGGHSVHLEGHTSSSINSSNVIKCVLHGFYRQSYGQNGFLFTNGDDTSHNRGVRVHQYRNNDNTVVGSIFFNTSSTDFNTSSDYRLKENEVLISDGITRIKQLKPYRFNFKSMPSETVDGFFAHEVASVVPFAVGGEKDEMKPNSWYQEGDTIPSGKAVGDVKGYSSTEMEIQQLDYSKLVTVTIAALQEAITKIETLETKVAALEAA
jgi:hypothetical protein